MNAADREALRQQALLGALAGDAPPVLHAGWFRESQGGSSTERGLAAYRDHADALAERALWAAFPTLQQLLGAESFAALARAFWRRHPPIVGDMGLWGAELAGFIADAASLGDEPYLADVARLEWAVHEAERAVDGATVEGLSSLADGEPTLLRLILAPGTAIVESRYPVVAIWQAHRSAAVDRFDGVKAVFAAGTGACALVIRNGWQAQVHALSPAEAAFTRATLDGRSLACALVAGGAGFDFERWLVSALREGRLAAVRDIGRQGLPLTSQGSSQAVPARGAPR